MTAAASTPQRVGSHRLPLQDMSRIRYLVSYDISNPKRLRRVARALEIANDCA